MKNKQSLPEYLEVDYAMADVDPEECEVRLKTRIVEVESNLLHRPLAGEGNVRHWKLEIYAEQRFLREDEDPEWREWHQPRVGYYSKFDRTQVSFASTLPFFYSCYGVPSPEEFYEHIYFECHVALFAVLPKQKDSSWHKFDPFREPELEDIYVYLKLHRKNYEKTVDFLRDIWYWRDRLWQTQKWFHYLMGDLESKCAWGRFDYPVGRKLLDWINPADDYPEEIDRIRASLK